MTRRELQEMRDAIAALQSDLAETLRELGELRSRVWELEQARTLDRVAARHPGAKNFQAGYPHGLGKGHE